MVTLIVATTIDPASIGPASALLAMPGWHPGPPIQVTISISSLIIFLNFQFLEISPFYAPHFSINQLD